MLAAVILAGRNATPVATVDEESNKTVPDDRPLPHTPDLATSLDALRNSGIDFDSGVWLDFIKANTFRRAGQLLISRILSR